MYSRKTISHESVASALAKAERYRLLNEPEEAESICRDILDIEPENQEALVHLVLALTDQLASHPRVFTEVLTTASRLTSPYERAYYEGIAWERRAKARFRAGGHGSHHVVFEWLANALHKFEEAERVRPHGDDEAILRWNACVRYLEAHPNLAPQAAAEYSPISSE